MPKAKFDPKLLKKSGFLHSSKKELHFAKRPLESTEEPNKLRKELNSLFSNITVLDEYISYKIDDPTKYGVVTFKVISEDFL